MSSSTRGQPQGKVKKLRAPGKQPSRTGGQSKRRGRQLWRRGASRDQGPHHQLVELVDQGQVERGAAPHRGIAEAFGDVQGGAIGGVAELLAEGRPVVLRVEDLQGGNQLGPLVYPVQAAA